MIVNFGKDVGLNRDVAERTVEKLVASAPGTARQWSLRLLIFGDALGDGVAMNTQSLGSL